MKLVMTGNVLMKNTDLEQMADDALSAYLTKIEKEQPDVYEELLENIEHIYYTEVAVSLGFKMKGSDDLQVLSVDPMGQDMPEVLVVECPVTEDGKIITEEISDNEKQSLYSDEHAALARVTRDSLENMKTIERKYRDEQYELVTDINIGQQATINICLVNGTDTEIVSVQYCFADSLESYYHCKQEVLIDLSSKENKGKTVEDVVSHYESIYL